MRSAATAITPAALTSTTNAAIFGNGFIKLLTATLENVAESAAACRSAGLQACQRPPGSSPPQRGCRVGDPGEGLRYVLILHCTRKRRPTLQRRAQVCRQVGFRVFQDFENRASIRAREPCERARLVVFFGQHVEQPAE